jgi:hypothetical protein
MRTNPFSAAATLRGAALRRFALHYIEMLVAMGLGMVLLMPLWRPVLAVVGAAGLLDRATAHLLVMATDMALGMAAWMLVRRHSRAAIIEMTLAMYVPFAVLLVPLWAGALPAAAVSAAGHLLMLPAMALAMLLRAGEYTHHHAPSTPHPAA